MRYLGIALMAAAAPLAGQDFEWSGALDPGQTIQIQGILGTIHAIPGGAAVEVTATKHGRRRQFDEVTFIVDEHADGVTICAVYPERRRARRDDCDGDRHDGVDLDDVEVEVEFTVRVPRGISFRAALIDGDIDARGLDAEVRAATVHGDITVETSGVARATTVAGSIHAAMGGGGWGDDLTFTTVSGDITLVLPADTDADVRMTTLSGHIESEFPLTLRDRGFLRMGMRGVIGRGGPALKLTTVSGDVSLERR